MAQFSQPSRTVLIVEDEILIRVLLSDLFEDAGYEVLEAASPADAMSLARNKANCIELMLTDVKMPGDADGLALASWMREHCPDAKIIIMSGYAGEQGNEQAHAYDAFVRKPFHPPQLVAMAQELLDKEPGDASDGPAGIADWAF